MTRSSQLLIILEGVDGAGKTTLGMELCRRTNATYQHFGPLKNVKQHLARCYVDAMMPAVLGYQAVVMDRSWLSEPIYADAYRNGERRLDHATTRMLERLAARCQTIVIHCRPEWEAVEKSFLSRKDEEYLPDTTVLKQVYDGYASLSGNTALPVIRYDYVKQLKYMAGAEVELDWLGIVLASAQLKTTAPHLLNFRSAGFTNESNVLVVGEHFPDLKDGDHWYQWPFASFNKEGCSNWLTHQLHAGGISENKLCFINADQPFEPGDHGFSAVVALGSVAETKVKALGWSNVHGVEHPKHRKPYELVDLLKDLTEPQIKRIIQ